MKRFVLLTCVVLFGVLWIAAYSVVSLRSEQSTSIIPKIDAHYLPGQVAPSNLTCVVHFPDFQRKYCDFNNEPISVVIQNKRIIRTSIYVYDSGLTVGDMLTAWGAPIKASFTEIGTAALYWDDHSTYVLTGQ